MAIAYNNFSTEKVFGNEEVNIICNNIYETILEKFTSSTVNTDFAITGTVAKIIQGAALEDIVVMPFITNNSSMLNFVLNELPEKVNALGAVKLTDRVQLFFNNIYVEIWYNAAIGTLNTVSNLRVQATADIPLYIN